MVVSDETDPDDNCVDLQREELEILEVGDQSYYELMSWPAD